MKTTIKGTLLPLPQETIYDFDPARGYIYRTVYKGASQAQMLALQQDYVRAGIACRLTFHQGDTASLDIEDATQQYTIDTWQIVGSEESRDGLSHPTVVLNCAPDLILKLRAYAEFATKTADAFTDTDLAGLPAVVKRFYGLQISGQTEYYRQQYVLRHTTNAPNRWNANVSDFWVDTIYTQAQLLSEAQSAALWVYPLPGRLAAKIAAIATPAAVANYQWGWLKRASTETTAANNRIDITTEYTLEQWSTDYYALSGA